MKSDCGKNLADFGITPREFLISFWFYFHFILISQSQKHWNNSIYEIPKFPCTLNINNKRTTIGKPISLGIIRKPIKYTLKKRGGEGNIYSQQYHDISVAGKSVLWPT